LKKRAERVLGNLVVRYACVLLIRSPRATLGKFGLCMSNPRTKHAYVKDSTPQTKIYCKTQNVVSCILLWVWRKCLFNVLLGNAI